MRLKTYFHIAFSETRNARAKLLFSVFSIIVGVASVAAIRSIIISCESSIHQQARNLMGSDLSIRANRPLKKDTKDAAIFTEIEAVAQKKASMVVFNALLQRKDSGNGQILGTLVNVRAVDQSFPFYGKAVTKPPNMWRVLASGKQPNIIIDSDVLNKLGLKTRDRVHLGEQTFTVLAVNINKAGSFLSAPSTAPSVYIPIKYIKQTGLLLQGSRISFRRLYKTPPDFDIKDWKTRHFDQAARNSISLRTYHEAAGNAQVVLVRFSTFLTVIGLITLLLSGAGVGSALSVFMKEKQKNVAVFRNLGLMPRQVFLIYFFLAMGMGLVASLVGAFMGALLPLALFSTDYAHSLIENLPFALEISFSWKSVIYAAFSGLCITLIFILLPVYRLRQVSPLSILRTDVSRGKVSKKDPKEILILGSFFTFVFGLCIVMAAGHFESFQTAFQFAVSIPFVLAVLFLFSWLIIRSVRLILPYVRFYNLRQGLANLYRPHNQTTLVITSLGAGFFLLGSIFVFEASLQREFNYMAGGGKGNAGSAEQLYCQCAA